MTTFDLNFVRNKVVRERSEWSEIFQVRQFEESLKEQREKCARILDRLNLKCGKKMLRNITTRLEHDVSIRRDMLVAEISKRAGIGEKLEEMNTLVQLGVSQTTEKSQGFAYTSLKEQDHIICLRNRNMGDVAVLKVLEETKGLIWQEPRPLIIDLSRNFISNTGGKKISQCILNWDASIDLDVSFNCIGDVGIKHLVRVFAIKNGTLKLKISNNRASAQVILELLQRIPLKYQKFLII